MTADFNHSFNITIQEKLKHHATILAKAKGFNGLQPLVRSLLLKFLENRKLEIMQKNLLNTTEDRFLTLDKFNQEIDRTINNA